MNKNTTFHPKLIIVDHFDDIQNQIDLKTEALLCSQNLNENDRKIFNELRQNQLEKIKDVQERNLSRVTFDEKAYKLKWEHVMNDTKLTFEKKIEILKEELILFDCILIDDKKFKSGVSLWVTPWFYNEINLEFLR